MLHSFFKSVLRINGYKYLLDFDLRQLHLIFFSHFSALLVESIPGTHTIRSHPYPVLKNYERGWLKKGAKVIPTKNDPCLLIDWNILLPQWEKYCRSCGLSESELPWGWGSPSLSPWGWGWDGMNFKQLGSPREFQVHIYKVN